MICLHYITTPMCHASPTGQRLYLMMNLVHLHSLFIHLCDGEEEVMICLHYITTPMCHASPHWTKTLPNDERSPSPLSVYPSL